MSWGLFSIPSFTSGVLDKTKQNPPPSLSLTEWTCCLLLHISLKLRGYKCTCKRQLCVFMMSSKINFLSGGAGLYFSPRARSQKEPIILPDYCVPKLTFPFFCLPLMSVSLSFWLCGWPWIECIVGCPRAYYTRVESGTGWLEILSSYSIILTPLIPNL